MVVCDRVGDWIVGVTRQVLDVINFVPESLKTDDIVYVLPDHASARHASHESQNDNFFLISSPGDCVPRR
jgi:hypothetical protein